MDGEGTNTAARWRVGEWLADGSMEAVAEINAQCLDFLCELATQLSCVAPSRRAPAMFGGQLDAWRGLSPAARAQLAASPYLLVEAGFDDENRWALPARRMVQDQGQAPRRAGVHRSRRRGFHARRAGAGLAPGARQPAAGPRGAGHVAGLRRARCRTEAARSGLGGRPPPGVGAGPAGNGSRGCGGIFSAQRCDSDTALLTQVSLRGLQLMAAGVLAPGSRSSMGAAL